MGWRQWRREACFIVSSASLAKMRSSREVEFVEPNGEGLGEPGEPGEPNSFSARALKSLEKVNASIESSLVCNFDGSRQQSQQLKIFNELDSRTSLADGRQYPEHPPPSTTPLCSSNHCKSLLGASKAKSLRLHFQISNAFSESLFCSKIHIENLAYSDRAVQKSN